MGAVRSGRRPGILNAAAACVVLALVLVAAERAAQEQPPSIAEFAPQAQQIAQTPAEQAGTSAGASEAPPPGAHSSPTPGSALAVPTGALYKHCVGDPPRQIEDPQSPPCVAYWTGPNGGATSTGVTGQTIQIAVPGMDARSEAALVRFFNDRFEFYGRRLVPAALPASPSCDPTQQRSQADSVLKQVGAFASTSYGNCGGWDYDDELAFDHVVGIVPFAIMSTEQLRQRSPYLWAYPMAVDNLYRNLGAWSCGRLVGRVADHAGDLTLTSNKRIFGIIQDHGSPNYDPDTSPLSDAITSCGGTVPVVFHYYANATANPNFSAMQAAVVRMHEQGVTSIFCLCDGISDAIYASFASDQEYHPEWLTESYIAYAFVGWPADQRTHAFGVTFMPREVKWTDNPVEWALTGGDPTGGWNNNGQAPSRSSSTSAAVEQSLTQEYRDLLELAAGIQMAGPRLSPATFRSGLQRTAFPNPDTPIAAGHVGFEGGSQAMTLDGAEYWFSNTALSHDPSGETGAVCYVDGGARHSLGDWPQGGDPFFGPTCDSGGYPGQP